jgi:hypothetical protein
MGYVVLDTRSLVLGALSFGNESEENKLSNPFPLTIKDQLREERRSGSYY